LKCANLVIQKYAIVKTTITATNMDARHVDAVFGKTIEAAGLL